jgi:hypothetical protein
VSTHQELETNREKATRHEKRNSVAMPIGESYTPAGVIGASRPSIDSNISENVTKGKQREEIEVSSPGHTGIRDSGRDLAYRQPKGFWGTIWKHFKRYWLCYGLLGFVFLAVFLPVL